MSKRNIHSTARLYHLITFFYYLPPPLPLCLPPLPSSPNPQTTNLNFSANTFPPWSTNPPYPFIHDHPCSIHAHPSIDDSISYISSISSISSRLPPSLFKVQPFLTSKAQKIFCFVYDRKSRHLITARFGELMISSFSSFLAGVQGRWTVERYW